MKLITTLTSNLNWTGLDDILLTKWNTRIDFIWTYQKERWQLTIYYYYIEKQDDLPSSLLQKIKKFKLSLRWKWYVVSFFSPEWNIVDFSFFKTKRETRDYIVTLLKKYEFSSSWSKTESLLSNEVISSNLNNLTDFDNNFDENEKENLRPYLFDKTKRWKVHADPKSIFDFIIEKYNYSLLDFSQGYDGVYHTEDEKEIEKFNTHLWESEHYESLIELLEEHEKENPNFIFDEVQKEGLLYFLEHKFVYKDHPDIKCLEKVKPNDFFIDNRKVYN